jgi:hypothetical protein
MGTFAPLGTIQVGDLARLSQFAYGSGPVSSGYRFIRTTSLTNMQADIWEAPGGIPVISFRGTVTARIGDSHQFSYAVSDVECRGPASSHAKEPRPPLFAH